MKMYDRIRLLLKKRIAISIFFLITIFYHREIGTCLRKIHLHYFFSECFFFYKYNLEMFQIISSFTCTVSMQNPTSSNDICNYIQWFTLTDELRTRIIRLFFMIGSLNPKIRIIQIWVHLLYRMCLRQKKEERAMSQEILPEQWD